MNLANAVGAGTDIVSVERIARLRETSGAGFAQRWFTPAEIEYCESCAHPARHFAGRLAAKEAAFKAIGTQWTSRVPWRSIEIMRAESGSPSIQLHDAAAEAARAAGIEAILISISHSDSYAVATAIATAAQSPAPPTHTRNPC